MSRRDVVIVASVSAIYGLGAPQEYAKQSLILDVGEERDQRAILGRLVELQYERNDIAFARNKFRVRGDTIEVFPAYEERAVRIQLFGDEVERIASVDPLTGEVVEEVERLVLFPASHYATDDDHMRAAIEGIEVELAERLAWLEKHEKLLEAQRLRMRTTYDLEMMREIGVCSGIENYSRHLDGRSPGQRPFTLLDYFPDDFLCVVDESHVTVPQLHGQFEGDRSRKETLVEHGFRLPSAMDNRPLRFEEFTEAVNQVVFLSATPSPYEIEVSTQVAEQIVRPTGLIDPEVVVRPTRGQIDDLVGEIRTRTDRDQRILVTTLTKKMAEDLTDYLIELGLRVRYLHSEVDTLERVEILRGLRLGDFDVLVGINLLREGLDLPEVSLVSILDADKEGFLRSETSLIQMIGRAARNVDGQVIMYADQMTDSMRQGDLGDQPPAQEAARVQRRARHRPADGAQEGHRHPRDAARCRRRVDVLAWTGPPRARRARSLPAIGGVRPVRRAARRPRAPDPDVAGRDGRRGRGICASKRRPACATRSRSSSGSSAPPSEDLRLLDRPEFVRRTSVR